MPTLNAEDVRFLALLATGRSHREIAAQMGVPIGNVERRVTILYRLFGVDNLLHLLEAAEKAEVSGVRVKGPIVTRVPLSETEREILYVASRVWCPHAVARIVGLKKRTVDDHLGAIYQKLGAASRLEAILKARGRA